MKFSKSLSFALIIGFIFDSHLLHDQPTELTPVGDEITLPSLKASCLHCGEGLYTQTEAYYIIDWYVTEEVKFNHHVYGTDLMLSRDIIIISAIIAAKAYL